jgi:hypothetical protein
MPLTHQRRYDLLASTLFLAGLLIRVVLWAFQPFDSTFSHVRMTERQNFLFLLYMLLSFALASFIRQGFKWAKLTYLIIFGLLAVVAVLAGIYLANTPSNRVRIPLESLSYWLLWLLQLVTAILLVLSLRDGARSSQVQGTAGTGTL